MLPPMIILQIYQREVPHLLSWTYVISGNTVPHGFEKVATNGLINLKTIRNLMRREADPDTDFSTLINTGKLATVRPNLEAIIVYQNFSNFEKSVRVVPTFMDLLLMYDEKYFDRSSKLENFKQKN